MKLAVFSDTHGSYAACEAICADCPDADLYIHLGDGYEQAQRLRRDHPTLPLLAVKGNCDFTATDADCKLTTLAGKRILYTHGHRFGVKNGLAALRAEAKRQSADIVLFGHTHLPLCALEDGVLYLNPGNAVTAAGYRYALLVIQDDGTVTADSLCAP